MFGEEESRIFVLVIQNFGINFLVYSYSYYGNGWDFILFVGWSMVFWVVSIYYGVRVGGFREL